MSSLLSTFFVLTALSFYSMSNSVICLQGMKVYTTQSTEVPPDEDRNKTEEDSDKSDDEQEAKLNNSGPIMLRTECIMQIVDHYESDSSDNIPLSKYIRLEDASTSKSSVSKSQPSKSTPLNLEWVKSNPKYNINIDCTPVLCYEEANQCKTPTDFFSLFFTESFCKYIVEQTNKYSQQKSNSINLTLNELNVFFGGLLLSGYAKYPNKRMYWSNQNDVLTILSDSMRLHRFETIIKNFHLNDNHHIDQNYRLYKLRPLIEELNVKFRQHGGLEESLSIDENKGFCATDTIQDGRTKNCPMSDKKVMEKQPKGTYDYRRSEDGAITLVRWKDNKLVTAATTYDTREETTCKCWYRERKRKKTAVQPQIFVNYNKGMGCVDKTDRTRKWYWSIFAYLFDVLVVNRWLLMKKLNQKDDKAASLLVFGRRIALSLLQSFGTPSVKGRTIPVPSGDVRYNGLTGSGLLSLLLPYTDFSELFDFCVHTGSPKSKKTRPDRQNGLRYEIENI
ncbi:hypothetical protein ILUMI_23564 [Ignelater luminosus]|uniref:PiggyBac transposable element-derived protein domain-containing protein n=1 Tax=Ignelater luminosus TaxID=2038154 RepID=A0A8K0CC67_IGNLU|nr:hypothetical protein ILUMI_23564 [Ignelater luminosus]